MPHRLPFAKTAKSVQLSAIEKESLKQAIFLEIEKEMSLASLSTLERSTLWHTIVRILGVQKTYSVFSELLLSVRRHVAYVVFILVFIVSSTMGTLTYASDSTLPGDTLYPIKLHIAEPIVGLFTRNHEDKVSWEAMRFERRMNEFDILLHKPERKGHLPPSFVRMQQHAMYMEQLLNEAENEDTREQIRMRIDRKIATFEGRMQFDVFDDNVRIHAREFDSFLHNERKRFAPMQHMPPIPLIHAKPKDHESMQRDVFERLEHPRKSN